MEISDTVIEELFKMADTPLPKNVEETDILHALIQIREKKEKNQPAAHTQDSQIADSQLDAGGEQSNSVLVVDDIGVVTYQLKVLLTQIGYNVRIAKDIFSAISTFVKGKYAYVIMDLFVSTEQEGYTLLLETKKIITKNNLNTKIIVITASTKAENKVKCLNGGADYFLKKDAGWQDKLIELVEGMQGEK